MLWGPFAVKAARQFQQDNGIAPVTGWYGPKTHQKLVKKHRKGSATVWAYDAYSIALMDQACAELRQMPDKRIDDGIVAEASRLYAHRNEIDYVQSRPFPLKSPPFLPGKLDCSGFATVCHFVGGAPDPNGRNYDGFGYTGTLMSRGVRCAERDLDPAISCSMGERRRLNRLSRSAALRTSPCSTVTVASTRRAARTATTG